MNKRNILFFFGAGISLFLLPAFRRRIHFLFLDLISLPGAIVGVLFRVSGNFFPSLSLQEQGLRINAFWHLACVCPLCPVSRRSMRDPEKKGFCMWEYQWKAGNYSIPPSFGLKNWFVQYLHGDTDLENYLNLYPRSANP